jgi:deazaflavin-dependent oxidoreductase (nitroreductase family)
LNARILPSIDQFVSRVTGGMTTATTLLSGLQVLLLTTTGAKTGAQRTQPVAYLGSGEDFVVIASNWGRQHNPGWYYNLRANLGARVILDGATFDVVARQATEAEHDRYWAEGTLLYPAWNAHN